MAARKPAPAAPGFFQLREGYEQALTDYVMGCAQLYGTVLGLLEHDAAVQHALPPEYRDRLAAACAEYRRNA